MYSVAKKVSEYFKFMQDLLQKQYKGVKHPMQLKDDERAQFFNQVRKEWEKHKSSKKGAADDVLSDTVNKLEELLRNIADIKHLFHDSTIPQTIQNKLEEYEKELSGVSKKYINLMGLKLKKDKVASLRPKVISKLL